MRMIDADAFAEFVHEYVLPQSPDGLVTKLAVLAAIDHKSITPTVQEPVRHGKWVSKCEPHYECSVCHHWFHLYDRTNYCPNCGAKMDGDGDAR